MKTDVSFVLNELKFCNMAKIKALLDSVQFYAFGTEC